MKLTCIQENLNNGLQTTGHLVNKNINLPILNNVLLEAKDGVLKLSSTNLEIGIIAEVRCKVETEGSFTIDAKLLSDYVSFLPNDQISLDLDADDFLKISCRSHETRIKGMQAEDFPVIPKIEKEKPFKVNIQAFKKALSQVMFSVANSETRPEIGGVYMNFNKFAPKSLFIVGTDSYRLAEKKLDLEEAGLPAQAGEEKEIIVPLKTLQEVARILGNIKEGNGAPETMEIYISENQILFAIDGSELISRLIEGIYPDYRQILPKETKTSVNVSVSELQKTIKTVALFSKTGIFDINIVFDPAKGLIVKAANIQVGESTASVDVDFTGEKNETTVNYRYLLDGLTNLSAEDASLSLVDANIPLILKAREGGDYLYIIMPIKQ